MRGKNEGKKEGQGRQDRRKNKKKKGNLSIDCNKNKMSVGKAQYLHLLGPMFNHKHKKFITKRFKNSNYYY